ncbi:MAG: CoA transferase [Chloroflexi bacterium]|nr:CoA transferase [Chloroflexota bacterium]
MRRLPLHGIRVLDLSKVWAGPYCTRLLGDLGAEVIKVEAAGAWDMTRSLSLLSSSEERIYNRSAYFNHYNRNKYGCTIDLGRPEGRALAIRLAAMSDVVIENFRSDVMAQFDLTYEALRSVRPDVIMVSMPSHGLEGPEARHVAYGTHIEQLGGLVSLNGYPDGPPQRSGISSGDPLAGATAAAATLAALLHRRWTGEGQHVEVAQWEAFLPFLGEFFVEHSMTGRPPERRGNRHASMAPHGAYPCRDEDTWVAVAVASDAEFAALCGVIGRPELARDERFADVVSRHRNQDALDEIVSAWTRTRTHREAATELQAAGVSAAPVLEIPEMVADPHLAARGFWVEVTHREAGTWTMDGPAWRFSLTPPHVRLPAPAFGEHNEYVLRGLLGLSDEEVAALEAAGVTAREPAAGQDV